MVAGYNDDFVFCNCTHLTDFGAAAGAIGAEALGVLSQSPAELFSPSTIAENIVVFATLLSLTCFCLGCIYLGNKQDKKDAVREVPEMAGKMDDENEFLKVISKRALMAEGFVSGVKQKQARLSQKVESIRIAEQRGEKVARKIQAWAKFQ